MMETQFSRIPVEKRIFGWDRDGTGMGQGWDRGGTGSGPMWGDDTLLRGKLCFEAHFLAFGHDQGPMWGHGALIRRELCFDDHFVGIWI